MKKQEEELEKTKKEKEKELLNKQVLDTSNMKTR